MSNYQQQAADFLSKHSIKFSAKLSNTKFPKWFETSPHGNHFRVSMWRGKNRIAFDFWDSFFNQTKGITSLDAYSVLSCCASDINCPDTFEEFCGDFGYPAYNEHTGKKDKQSFNTFKACKKQSEKLNKLFNTAEMREDLSKIQ